MFGFGSGFAVSGIAALIGLLTTLFFWIVVIALAIWLVKAFTSPSRRTSEDSAMRILRERYARGEIDTAEFEQARRTLERDGR